MKLFWEYYEKLDEMVYVSDTETYEIIYMNKCLRNSLGLSDFENYKGKKCYKVLQGFDSPCFFCNNKSIKEGEFLSWTHKNPILDKRFLIKDSMISVGDRKYRIEVAIDIDSEVASSTPYYYARSETVLNECLHQIFSTNNPEESTERLLSYIGKTFLCDRVYIFEIHDNDRTSNTYEWCADGVIPQKEILQNEHISAIDWWIKEFEENKIVVINDLENIRTKYPSAYALLKPQNISTLVVGPITIEGELVGFIGVDNPEAQMMSMIKPLINVIGYFTSTLIRRRDLLRLLNKLSYNDQLTGAFNRNAFTEYTKNFVGKSMGVIFCDITGLKRVNDTLGHEAGDRLICDCFNLIKLTLNTNLIYRIGGDEFVVFYPEYDKLEFDDIVSNLRNVVSHNENHIAIGSAWSNIVPISLEKLISKADQEMYVDKKIYYKKYPKFHSAKVSKETISVKAETEFNKFLNTSYYDVESLFESISYENPSSYFYFGDMEKNLFYISDNLKDDFGFSNNVVPELLNQWSKRISTPEFCDLYWQDIHRMLREKDTIHDLRYQVRDIKGRNIWIRCYGILKWNEDKSKPLFFSGRITHQDEDFVVDPITNFPREHTAYIKIKEIEKNQEKKTIIGFTFSNITEINGTRGRNYADKLIKNIAEELTKNFSNKIDFYRLEGMRCMAIIDNKYTYNGIEDIINQIKDVVKSCYHRLGIYRTNVCSFGVIEYPCDSIATEDIVEIIISLLRLARQNTKDLYIDYSEQNICKINQISNISLTLIKDILNDMKNFKIFVQPIVFAENGSIVGGEVLLRWSFNGKNISPSVFIPMIEKESLINIVGKWVFEQAVIVCMRVISYIPNFYITFNVSLQQLYDETFLDFMQKTLQKYNIDGSHLVAELTESCIDEQPEKLEMFIEGCKKLNIRIALDDFGSGYSSLRMLLQYPSNIIKLDKSLLMEMSASDRKKSFISSIVYACHEFGKNVCMEGVETEFQNKLIKETKCDMIQGYYYYKPMEIRELYKIVSKN